MEIEEGEANDDEEKVTYNPDSLFEYPGFNAPVPLGVFDVCIKIINNEIILQKLTLNLLLLFWSTALWDSGDATNAALSTIKLC